MIFNLITIKISQISMPKIKNLIKQHNLKIWCKDQDKMQRSYNCIIKESCPLNGNCLHQCMVYKTEETTNTTYKEYYRISVGEFKSRQFRHISQINDAEYSKYLWTSKVDENHPKWSIKSYASRYKWNTKFLLLQYIQKFY